MLFSGLLLFLFLIIVRPQDFILSIRGMPIVFAVMGTLLAGWLFSSYDKRFIRTVQDRYCLSLFLVMIFSTLSANWLAYTFDTAIETAKTVLIYWFIVSIVDTAEKFKRVNWAITLLMSVVAGMGVMQAYGYDITGSGMYWAADKGTWQIRGTGLFDNPNDLAYSVVVVVPFVLGVILGPASFLKKSAAFLLLTISIYCIYLTRSRGGYLALFVCCTVCCYFWISNVTVRRFALVLGILLVLAAFTVKTSGYREDESSMGRVESWAAGMHMFVTHPLLGVGKGLYSDHHKLDSHNSFVRAGAELGFIGLYSFLGMLFSALRFLHGLRATGKKEPGEEWKVYRIGMLAYLSAYLVGSLFSTRTYDIIFMVVIALTAVLERFSLAGGLEPHAMQTESFWNKKVFAMTLCVLITWKLFLFQVW